MNFLRLKYLPWILAAMWFICRVVAGKTLEITASRNFGVLSNILLILILIFLSIFYAYRGQSGSAAREFFEDFKTCMKPALKYVIAVTAGIGIYYGLLSNDLQVLQQAHITAFNDGIQIEENFKTFVAEHPEFAQSTKEQIMQANKENVERNASLQTNILGAVLALTFVSLVYSLLAVFFWRMVVKKI